MPAIVFDMKGLPPSVEEVEKGQLQLEEEVRKAAQAHKRMELDYSVACLAPVVIASGVFGYFCPFAALGNCWSMAAMVLFALIVSFGLFKWERKDTNIHEAVEFIGGVALMISCLFLAISVIVLAGTGVRDFFVGEFSTSFYLGFLPVFVVSALAVTAGFVTYNAASASEGKLRDLRVTLDSLARIEPSEDCETMLELAKHDENAKRYLGAVADAGRLPTRAELDLLCAQALETAFDDAEAEDRNRNRAAYDQILQFT